HKHLRNVNMKAFEPEVISVGPYHPDKDNLKIMKDHKLSIEQLERSTRNCYTDPICLHVVEFIEMLVLDGCFIIDLVRKCNMIYLREKNDPIFHMDKIVNSLQQDLMLFENLVPFFILCKLFDLIDIPNQHSSGGCAEQYFGNTKTNYVMDYLEFLDCLTDSLRDVAILLRHRLLIFS
ncbi:hypothetical protein MIMGU_mgv1a019904mg, partial [Erythranthe guttata]